MNNNYPISVSISLPSGIIGELNRLIMNTVIGRPAHNARAEIMESLLVELIEAFKEGKDGIDGKEAMAKLKKYAHGNDMAKQIMDAPIL